MKLLHHRRRLTRNNLKEINEYVHYLKDITKLRDHAVELGNTDEADRYEVAIEVGTLVLIELQK